MSTHVIGSRYRLGSVVTCTPEATTWDARDTWLDERVLVVTPEPGCEERFAALAGAVLDRSSSHLVGLYDIGATTDEFVVFGVPAATLSDEQAPREEGDVLIAGRALGDALEALHERGIVHGDLHPGSVVVAGSGGAALSPWPLAPRPHNWSGPGGFGTDPDEPRDVSTRDDVRALGAVLLGALAGPPLLSSEQIANIERELAGRAPNAVTIADRALTPPACGGYAVAAEVRDDCAAVLAGRPVAATVSDLPMVAGTAPVVAGAETEAPEGRRAALVLAASGAALFAGIGVAGSIGAGPHAPGRPIAHAVWLCRSLHLATLHRAGRRPRWGDRGAACGSGRWSIRRSLCRGGARTSFRCARNRLHRDAVDERNRGPPAGVVDNDDVTPEHDDIEQPEHHHDGTAGYDHHCTDHDNDGAPEYDDIDVFQRGASRAEQRK